MVKIRDRSTVRVQITSGSPIVKTISNNTKTPCQCSYSLIYVHAVTTALSDCLQALHVLVSMAVI